MDSVTLSKNVDFRAILSELIGTTLFLYIGISIATLIGLPDVASKFLVSLVFGISATCAINATAHTKGGQMNPAVTIAFAASGYLSIIQAILNIVAQCVASVLASALVLASTPDLTLGYNAVAPDVDIYQAFIGEVMCTLFLVFVVLEICHVPDNQYGNFAPITVGFVIFIGNGILTSLDGCSLNPVRSLGPALLENEWEDFWVFVIGPILGGLIAVPLHKILRIENFNKPYEAGKSVDPGV